MTFYFSSFFIHVIQAVPHTKYRRAGFSPFFIFDEGAGIDPKAYYDVADKHKLPYSNFMKRAFLLELNRQAIDYIHSQKSDYLLLDSTVFRFTYFKTADNKYFVNGIKNQRTEFYKVLARELKLPPVADPCVPCDFLDDDEISGNFLLYYPPFDKSRDHLLKRF